MSEILPIEAVRPVSPADPSIPGGAAAPLMYFLSPIMASAMAIPKGPVMICADRHATITAFSPVAR